MIHARASGLGITSGEQDSTITQQRCRGKAESIQRCTSRWNECSGVGIIDFWSLGTACYQYPAIFE
jgi:hypothetical protein